MRVASCGFSRRVRRSAQRKVCPVPTVRRGAVLGSALLIALVVVMLATSCGEPTGSRPQSAISGVDISVVSRAVGSETEIATSFVGKLNVETGTGRLFVKTPGATESQEVLLVEWTPFGRIRSAGESGVAGCGERTWLSGASLRLEELQEAGLPLATASEILLELRRSDVRRRVAELDPAQMASERESGTVKISADRLGLRTPSTVDDVEIEFDDDGRPVGASWESQAPSELSLGNVGSRARSVMTISEASVSPVEEPDPGDVCDGGSFDPLAGLD